jgi:hypothetical protein
VVVVMVVSVALVQVSAAAARSTADDGSFATAHQTSD